MIVMEEIRRSPVEVRLVVYSIIYKVLNVSGGSGFLPSTVSLMVVDIPERESVVRYDAYQMSFLSSNCGRQVPFCWGRLDLSSSAVLHPIS